MMEKHTNIRRLINEEVLLCECDIKGKIIMLYLWQNLEEKKPNKNESLFQFVKFDQKNPNKNESLFQFVKFDQNL